METGNEILAHDSPFGTNQIGGETRIEHQDFTHLDPDDTQGASQWFGHVQIAYVARDKVMDSTSVARYLESYRDKSVVPEHAVNQICEDLKDAIKPMAVTVNIAYRQRSKALLSVQARYLHPDAKAPRQKIQTL